jgi:cyclopropane fatty-acyl-phospholipid synthase-like methyltransferase
MSEQRPPGTPQTAGEWDAIYETANIEGMPWFYAALDPDVERALARLGRTAGTLLDLGTGPGTQAIALAARGFEVTGTDFARSAVTKAQARAAAAGARVTFVEDDVLASKLEGSFDTVLDRGCFHVVPPEQRPAYVATLARLVAKGGHLLLKTFSVKQPGELGPYRFTPELIRTLFEGPFEVLSVDESVYFGTFEPPPIALFSVLARR